MQHILMLIFSSSLLLLPGLQFKSGDDIVGRWEAQETTRGGLGSTLRFNRDGSFNSSFGPQLNGTYKLDGNKLIITTFQSPPQKPSTEVCEIKIEGDTLFEKTEYGMQKMVRLSPRTPGNLPIVGRWGAKAPIIEFRRDGSFDVDIGSSNNGTYQVDGNHLYLTYSSRDVKNPVKHTFEIEIKEDTMRWREDQRNTVMRRISPSNAEVPAIIGKWSALGFDGTDILSTTEYKANGEWTFRMAIMVHKGRYSIKRDLLTTTFEGGETKISRLRFDRGLMLLKSPPKIGPEDKFRRIE